MAVSGDGKLQVDELVKMALGNQNSKRKKNVEGAAWIFPSWFHWLQIANFVIIFVKLGMGVGGGVLKLDWYSVSIRFDGWFLCVAIVLQMITFCNLLHVWYFTN